MEACCEESPSGSSDNNEGLNTTVQYKTRSMRIAKRGCTSAFGIHREDGMQKQQKTDVEWAEEE